MNRRALGSVSLAKLLLLSCCDGAFESGGSAGAGNTDNSFGVQVHFADGSDSTVLADSGTLSMTLEVPTPGFDSMLTGNAGGIEPDRLLVTTNPPLSAFLESNLTPRLLELGFLTAESQTENDTVPLKFEIPLSGPLEFPLGLVVWQFVLIDDIDRPTEPVKLELTIQAADRPTAVLRLEIPSEGPLPTGLLLPTDENGVFFIGENLPFTLSLEGIPNAESGASFSELLGNGELNPEKLIVTADRDLGDPGVDGFFAGENLAELFGEDIETQVDENTGQFLTGASFDLNGTASPPLGIVTISASIVDDEGEASQQQSIALSVVPPVTLQKDVQPIFSSSCAILPGSCHDTVGVFQNLVLTDPENSFLSLVNVPAGVAPGSCTPTRVDPYFAANSYVISKLRGTHDDADNCAMGFGDQMPPLGTPLPDEQIAAIEMWIKQGAHNN